MDTNVANWRTTVAGILAGATPIVIGYLQGDLSLDKFAIGIGIFILGYFSKDARVGSKPSDTKL